MASIKSKDSKAPIKCFLCKHATLMQWMENPIVADCKLHHERFVAMSEHPCTQFEASGIPEPEIIHYDHYEEEDNF